MLVNVDAVLAPTLARGEGVGSLPAVATASFLGGRLAGYQAAWVYCRAITDTRPAL